MNCLDKQLQTEEVAVWDGRFQPFHIGHMAVIKSILEQFGAPLALMVIQSSEGFHDEYSRAANEHHKLPKNPLSFWERRLLIQAALKAEGLLEQVVVSGIHRPDLDWQSTLPFYPGKRFICLTGKDEYERKKATFWHAKGEQTRLVDVTGVENVSASEFKRTLRNGGEWQQMLHPSTVDLFISMNGVQRFMDDQSKSPFLNI
jgi:cytidyltransferase-like protein